MIYEEKIGRVSAESFFSFFDNLNAAPRWVHSAGKRSIQLLGLCHHGSHHSCVFDPTTLTVTCFSECGCGMLIHNWVKKVLNTSAQEAKEIIEDWIDENKIPLGDGENFYFEYEKRTFIPEKITPLKPIPRTILKELYKDFDTSIYTLSKLSWSTQDKIWPAILKRFQVAYYPKHKTIILPHHNINGEIVGIFERNFAPLRAEVKQLYPEMTSQELVKFPRAKYLPLLKEGDFKDYEEERVSWSFPNSQNLYGLHLAKKAIKESGKAIIFEGAKSVMLAHQYGFQNAVATHTFGANFNHISMLIECGAKEIIFAFDKQYQKVDVNDPEWNLYEKKTRDLANEIGEYIDVSRIVDFFPHDERPYLLKYKDSPIDNGKRVFEKLYTFREILIKDKKEVIDANRLGNEIDILKRLTRPKKDHRKPKTEEEEEKRMTFFF